MELTDNEDDDEEETEEVVLELSASELCTSTSAINGCTEAVIP